MKKNPNPKRFKCRPSRHVWPVWEQGGTLMANGHLPGDVCQCGKMLIIDRQCDCGQMIQQAVKFDSPEAIEWGGPEV